MSVIPIAYVEVDGVDVDEWKTLSISKEWSNKEGVPTMNRAGEIIGYKSGIKLCTGSATIARVTSPSFDARASFDANALHLVVYEEAEGGKRYRLSKWTILTMENAYDVDGDAMVEITWQAAKERAE